MDSYGTSKFYGGLYMKKSLWIWIPLVAVLLTGCSGNDGEDSIAEGMAAMENKDYQAALEDFKTAAALGENDAAAYRGEGIALLGMGQYAEAAQAFDTALAATDEKMPNTKRDILYYKATALYKNGDYENTISVCDEILAINQEGDACYLRGACYMAQGDYDKAKSDFDAAVALSPEDYTLVLDIYGCYQEQKRSADGAHYLENALNIEDSSDEGNYQKARIYVYLENYDSAKSLLSPLVEEKNGEAMALMAKIYLKEGDTAHARNLWKELLSSAGESLTAYNGLVLCDIQDGDYAAALENADKGLALSGVEGRQELMYNAIVACEYQGDFDNALVKAQEYVEKYPTDERGTREYTFLQTR